MTSMSDVTALRLQVRRNGFDPLPLEGKVPHMSGWQQKFEVSEDEIKLWPKTWHLAASTGVLAKFAPGMDIDITIPDAADAVETLAREHFEERGDIHVRFGKPPKRLIPLRTDEPFTKLFRVFIAPDGSEQKIEFLGDGQQYVVDGIHPDTHKPYGWHGGELATIKREDLPYVRREDAERFLDAATKLLVEEFGFVLKNESKQQQTKTNGSQPHAAGEPQASPALIAAALAVIPNDADWERWYTLGMAVWRATAGSGVGFAAFDAWSKKSPKYNAHTTAQKWAAFFKSPPTQIGAGTIFHLADQASPTWRQEFEARKNEPQPQPAPQPSGGAIFDPWERYIVPAFPFDILPDVARDFVAAQSSIIGCDGSGLAMTVLGTFSGALHHGFALKMLRHGNWQERPRLWVLLIADSSGRKTPILVTATRPLVHYETHLRVKYEHDLRDYEQAQAQAEGQGQNTALRKPDPPPRYVVWDTTVEKLGELMARNEKGLLIKSDEISGWLGSMERYHNSASRSDRAFWLSAYDGGPHSVDRIRRGELFIKNLSASLIGCIQPTRLAEMQGLTSDGLLQRFLPVMMGESSFPQDQPCDDNDYSELIRALIFAKPARLIMTDDALAVMKDLRQRLFDLEQASGGLAAGFQSFVGKLHGIVGALALILHMAHDPQGGATQPVDEHTVANVHRLIFDFILPHAHEFYCGGESADGERLRQIASWILTSSKDRILASDLTTNVRDCRGLSLRDVHERLSPLVAAGWLEPESLNPLCRAWKVTPQVHSQFAERTRTEQARKAAIRAQILESANARRSEQSRQGGS
jgi:hypothetical protein